MYTQYNLESLFTFIGNLKGQSCIHTQNYSYIITPENAWPNLIFNVDFTTAEFDDGIETLIQLANNNQLPATIMGSPIPNILTHKKLESLNVRSGEWHAMYYDTKWPLSGIQTTDISIHEVDDKEHLHHWYTIIFEVLMQGLPTNRAIIEALYRRENCYLFIGIKDHKPVATSLLFIEDNSGGIYYVVTEETSRNKGYGKALTHAAMRKAKELGCTHIELQATNSGKPIYQKLGFVEAGNIPLYKLKNQSS